MITAIKIFWSQVWQFIRPKPLTFEQRMKQGTIKPSKFIKIVTSKKDLEPPVIRDHQKELAELAKEWTALTQSRNGGKL